MADADNEFDLLLMGFESHERVVARAEARRIQPDFDELSIAAQRQVFRQAWARTQKETR